MRLSVQAYPQRIHRCLSTLTVCGGSRPANLGVSTGGNVGCRLRATTETRFTLNRRVFRRLPARKRGLIAVVAAAVAAGASLGLGGCGGAAAAAPLAPGAQADKVPGAATGLGQLSGLLPRDHLTLESAIQVDLSTETVRLPLYPGIAYAGTPHQEKVWYILMDSSDAGTATRAGL